MAKSSTTPEQQSQPGPWVARALVGAERQIALITRCKPLNWATEEQRLVAAWLSGAEAAPGFVYAPRAELGALESDLVRLRDGLTAGAIADLYRERIDELLLELALASGVGSPELPSLSRQRYESTPAGTSAASELARAWLCGAAWTSAEDGRRVRTDDASKPDSLLSRVRALVGRERLPFRVEISDSLVSLAATGEDFIVIAAGRYLPPLDAERVAVHEVFGHASPRARARSERLGLFTCGSAGGNDCQEGYAVYCEQSRGVLHPLRRAELALRHLAARSVWEGRSFIETVRELLTYDAPVDLAVRVAARAFRGGGLAREGAYLPAYCGLVARAPSDPLLVSWLGAGRVSFEAIEVLRREGYDLLGIQSRNSATTGT